MIEKIIYIVFALVVINISVTANNIDSGDSSNYMDHKTGILADTIYSCTMHPDIKSLQTGICPECKMDLIPHEYAIIDSTKSSSEDYYTCSMHPEVHSEKPGSCPECGMELIKKSEVSDSNDGMMGMMMNSPWMIVMGIVMVVMMTIHFVN